MTQTSQIHETERLHNWIAPNEQIRHLKSMSGDEYRGIKKHIADGLDPRFLYMTESAADILHIPERRNEFLKSPFVQREIQHDKSQDDTGALVEAANAVIMSPAPEAVGEMIVRRVNVPRGMESVKVRKSTRPIVGPTLRGAASRGLGTRTEWVTLTPKTEVESHEMWDEATLEDMPYNIAAEEASALSREVKIEISQQIIDYMADSTSSAQIADSSLNGGAEYSATTANSWTFDDMVAMRQGMLKNNVIPDCCVMHPDQVGDLLSDEAFLDSDKYGNSVRKSEGMLGRFMGMSIFETPQITAGTVLMLEKDNVLIYGVKRDKLLVTINDWSSARGQQMYGLSVSSRYTLALADGRYLSRCSDA